MRAQSARKSRAHRERVAWLRRTTHGPVPCAWPSGCGTAAVDAHEVLSRARGGSITDPDNVVPLCRPHHDYVTTNPVEAEQLGLARRAGVVPQPRATLAVVPQKASGLTPLHVRVKTAGVTWLDGLASRTSRKRSDVVRAALAVASQHEAEVLRYLTHPPKEKP